VQKEEPPATLKDMIKTRLENQTRFKNVSKVRDSKFTSYSSVHSLLPPAAPVKKDFPDVDAEISPSNTMANGTKRDEDQRSPADNSRIVSQEIQENNSLSRLSGLNEIDQ
jgi:hypothetical protein